MKKNDKNPLWRHFQPKQVGKGRKRDKIKIFFPFRSYPTGNRKFQKKRKKIRKSKNTVMASFQVKIGWKWPRNGENKNCSSVSFPLDAQQKIPKKLAKK